MSDLGLLCFGCELPIHECECEDGPTGYTACCEVCDHVWDVPADMAEMEADSPEENFVCCPKCDSDRTFAITEDTG